jgi:predicted TIM-barrel fold metal-dependent hydrolase
MLICDAQVHAPVVPELGQIGSIDEGPLIHAMRAAGVDRALIVPRPTPTQPADNGPSLAMAQAHPDRFGVVGLVDLNKASEGSLADELFDHWLGTPGMLAMRALCYREPNRTLFAEGRLDWLWSRAERHRIPVMVLSPQLLDRIADVAERFPDLRLVVDHMGVDPDSTYRKSDLLAVIEQVNTLAKYPNVAVKATRAPGTVDEPYPFPSAHEPLERLVDAYEPRRVFWGSDLTKLRCSYSECVDLFTKELRFLGSDDLEWVMGRAICEWVGWQL